ncbi:hypothetical protein PTSG_07961 [Salpingoeca rosetta]|uniref:B-related factor 1 n=1 Tax=Salpingoeca rosetta (strain ATCC 50818 / BSB-021) TaxID=946362 RepID=F2UGU3_SALR5|nr:uncharacterized protein PTSG_07961 [Salpingoeca rosetta]EGD75843.1 hypothetical protein PTSG_07961 [Salpingoeca rosetta]|eukprot:XP_004991764.1 hypothetical protein PTSG_07961 [Salpingoeca rosetta]
MSTCPSCGSDAVEEDRGTATCTVCGTVLEDSIIVSEVTYTEDSSVVEQYVGSDGQIGGLRGFPRSSIVTAVNTGRQHIENMARNMKLNQGHIDAAVKYYRMAAQQKFTAGRPSEHVAACCLYIVCREERSMLMLLDFADFLRVNVYKLASTFLSLRLKLSITLPVIDPVLFLPRFVMQLDLGDKQHDIGRTAIRIVSRMKRDWLHVGRRPAGICGAALLLAARMYGFARSQKDVVHAVRVCSSTVRKRLDEFAETPSARLTMDEFMSIDLEGEADPPAFKKSQEERQLALQSAVEECERLAASAEFASLDGEVTPAIQPHPVWGTAQPAATATAIAPATAAEASAGALRAGQKQQHGEGDGDGDGDEEDDDEEQQQQNGEEQQQGASTSPQSTASSSSSLQKASSTSTSPKAARGGGDGEPAPKRTKQHGSGRAWEQPTNDDELSDDSDDDELADHILNDEEVKVKTVIWTQNNQDYLERQARKREEEANAPKKPKKRRNQPRLPDHKHHRGAARERLKTEEKKSSKINYDSLQSLFGSDEAD